MLLVVQGVPVAQGLVPVARERVQEPVQDVLGHVLADVLVAQVHVRGRARDVRGRVRGLAKVLAQVARALVPARAMVALEPVRGLARDHAPAVAVAPVRAAAPAVQGARAV